MYLNDVSASMHARVTHLLSTTISNASTKPTISCDYAVQAFLDAGSGASWPRFLPIQKII